VCFLNSVQETPQNPRNGKGLQLVAYVPEGACRKAPQHFFQFLACPEKTLMTGSESNFQQVEVTNKVVIFFLKKI
jgi:hypothetical protein